MDTKNVTNVLIVKTTRRRTTLIMYNHICKLCNHKELRFAKLEKLKCSKCNGAVTIVEEGKP